MEELFSKYLFCHSDASISVIDLNSSHASYNRFSTFRLPMEYLYLDDKFNMTCEHFLTNVP